MLEQLQDGVDELTERFDRLDSRVASVGQTAAKIGDHLEVVTDSYLDVLNGAHFCRGGKSNIGYREHDHLLIILDIISNRLGWVL